ncbi:type II toxin-antitoxin system YafQ family toxin [Bifidobacterium sp. ESL0745]|uniref:type II toxin-antitoxin system RelE/ParE family toxin n=1 Tax=Bifidobacterium sp. ESL0745 TaxID=2983226 RepID=UPI0023F666DF|nr:type II toxin-antitoxin system YafQ family toxin [Bifidobacterium sp. ESL0745]MDF7666190.1 type II toxin-antitoxin system YafQ family toxin [Bifidobacterium sp. ESL0745]
MLDVFYEPAFLRDVRRLKRKHYDMTKLNDALDTLQSQDKSLLSTKYRDHALKGNLKAFRELHIEGDWLLVYQLSRNSLTLTLTRTGSHDDVLRQQ